MFLLLLCLAKSNERYDALDDLNDISEYNGEQANSSGFIVYIAFGLNCIGFILYIIFGLLCNDERKSCLCDCCKMDYHNKDNFFFTETVKLYELKEEKEKEERRKIQKQNAVSYLIETGALK